jgi:hypothetical protein
MFAALQAKRFDVVANQVTLNAERAALLDVRLGGPLLLGDLLGCPSSSPALRPG